VVDPASNWPQPAISEHWQPDWQLNSLRQSIGLTSVRSERNGMTSCLGFDAGSPRRLTLPKGHGRQLLASAMDDELRRFAQRS
jgi:hypothetical protein